MKIEREVVTKVKNDDGTSLEYGDLVVFVANGVQHIGEFRGVTRGNLSFEGGMTNEKVIFNIAPTSIKSLKLLEHKIDQD